MRCFVVFIFLFLFCFFYFRWVFGPFYHYHSRLLLLSYLCGGGSRRKYITGTLCLLLRLSFFDFPALFLIFFLFNFFFFSLFFIFYYFSIHQPYP